MHYLSRTCYRTIHRKRPLFYFSPVYKLSSSTNLNSETMSSRQALLLSSSNCHGYSTLEFAKEEICNLLKKNDASDLIFVPFAKNNFDKYTADVHKIISPWGFNVTGLHTFEDPAKAISYSKAIFVGGGNTFLLLKRLYDGKLVDLIRKRVLSGSMVYIGSSAGTNVATKSIHTTNDMPIIHPPTFDAIGFVGFNINPHYIDTVENEKHKGETRDQRILEFLEMPHAGPVLGLREGAILKVEGNTLTLRGVAGGVLFKKNGQKTDIPVGSDLSTLEDLKRDLE